MITWPTHTDYLESLQEPKHSFDSQELRDCIVATDLFGLPRVTSGNFASVYEITTTENQRWALRCFVRQVAGQQGRYALLSQYLSGVKVPWLVSFDYIQKGVLVQNEWYPVVKMQWIDGLPLNQYLEEHHADLAKVTSLAEQWCKLISDLAQNTIAHGDLQHGNIMVTSTHELRLVDYDGMYCPAFGKGRSPELGHANFQHAARTEDFYDESLDRFSALVIYLSFLALATDPALWKKFHSGDNLLFHADDLKHPNYTQIWRSLERSPSTEVVMLTRFLGRCCCAPPDAIPSLEDICKASAAGTLASLGLVSKNQKSTALPGYLLEETPASAPSGGEVAVKPVAEVNTVPRANRSVLAADRVRRGGGVLDMAKKNVQAPQDESLVMYKRLFFGMCALGGLALVYFLLT